MNKNAILNRKGFTLIELVIAVAIMGILVTIAYPSYTNYVLKSRRSDALATLTQDQMALERCYAQNFSYTAACTSLPAFPQVTPQGFYSISLSNLGASTYTLTATPIGTQTKDTTCSNMAVNQANVKTATDNTATAQSSCWNP